MILHFDLDLEDSKPIFLEDSLAHGDALPYRVWQYKVQHFRRQHLDKQSLTFCNFAVTLTLNTAIQSLHKTLWLMIMYHQTKFSSKKISRIQGYTEVYLPVTLKCAQKSVLVTLHLQTIHNKYRLIINNSDLNYYKHVVQLTQALTYPSAPTHS